MDSIKKIRNTVYLSFDKWGDSFSLDVPHYNKWRSIIALLRKRGFKITENPSYKEHFSCLSKYHKIGYKNDVAVLMEIGANRIEVQFGNIQNLWKGHVQSFWDDPSDERYTKLTYLEEAAVKLEIHRLISFCQKWDMPLKTDDAALSPEEKIIRKDQRNTHVHGKVECLEDIKNYITKDNHNYGRNSDDKNKKKIICGQVKYFYDYHTKRLSRGVVWHNINNMWWVIVGKELRNVAAFELFDYEPGMPRRNPVEARQIKRLLEKFQNEFNFEKCISIRNHASRANIKLEVA